MIKGIMDFSIIVEIMKIPKYTVRQWLVEA